MRSQWWTWEENPEAVISWLRFWPCLSSPAWVSVSRISVVAKHTNITADLALTLQFFAPPVPSLRTTTVLWEPVTSFLWDVFNFPVLFWEVLILRECLGLGTCTAEQLCCEEYGFNHSETMLLLITGILCDRWDPMLFPHSDYVTSCISYSLPEAIISFWNSVEQLPLQTKKRLTDDTVGWRNIMRLRKEIRIFQNYEDHGK